MDRNIITWFTPSVASPWECGLKPQRRLRQNREVAVAPPLGAWIETRSRCCSSDIPHSLSPPWERGLKRVRGSFFRFCLGALPLMVSGGCTFGLGKCCNCLVVSYAMNEPGTDYYGGLEKGKNGFR